MVLSRALSLVRDQRAIADPFQSGTTDAAPVSHVRESGADLLALINNKLQFSSTRNSAMQVPAFVKALKTYSHTISAFPLRQYVYGTPIEPRNFLTCPCSVLPYSAVIDRLVADLLMHDRAYWLVTDRTWDGYPSNVQVMRVEDVLDQSPSNSGIDPNAYAPSDPFYWLGQRVPTRDVIKFYGDGNGGWLRNGATAINTAASLEAATLMYSESPIPTVALKNNGADLPADQVDALLEAWEEARANRATAYLNSSIEAQTMGFSARDVQLVEGKQAAALALARLANLDPIWVGAGVPGSSLTYANRIDLYRQLLDTALRPVMALIEQRLSMGDITPRGHEIKFDTTSFLRGNPAELADLVTKLRPLEIITPEEARQILDLPGLGVNSLLLEQM
jgi:hypothetical protein